MLCYVMLNINTKASVSMQYMYILNYKKVHATDLVIWSDPLSFFFFFFSYS